MAVVTVTINGHEYSVACDDGQEEHLQSLAEYIDKRVAELAEDLGQVGEARLMLMAGLTIADELSESVDEAESLTAQVESVRTETAGAARNTIQEYASRIEQLAARLEASG